MKIADIPYERYDIETLKKDAAALTEKLKAAGSAWEQADVYFEMETQFKHFQTASTLANIRFSLNTEDKFYTDEMEYYSGAGPQSEVLLLGFAKAMLASPYRKELEKLLNPLLFKNFELQEKAISEAVVPELQEENKLVIEYDKLCASARFDWDGKELNAPLLGRYMADKDRSVRERAYRMRGEWLVKHGPEIDDIYDRMVKVRDRIAKKLGYRSFTEVGYYRMQRNCYGAPDVAVFRRQVKDSVVPVVAEMKKRQAAMLGIDKMKIYDYDICLPQGSPTPQGTVEQLFEGGRKMYAGISPQTSEFFGEMMDNDAFDVISRPGKSSGGYCTTIPDYRQEFIFANFNGTNGDIDVLTHEFGHAFASYLGRDNKIYLLSWGGMETCEVHSMSMEFFCWPYMDLFFGKRDEEYRYCHLASAISFLPYGTIVDYFQQLVYDNPGMTPKERNDTWLKLEKEFRPYYDNAGVPGYEDGRRWQIQSHIFESPFYYIDYCLAQSVAIQFLLANLNDHEDAWKRYVAFARQGGRNTYVNLVREAGLAVPFEEGSLAPIVDRAAALLKTMEADVK